MKKTVADVKAKLYTNTKVDLILPSRNSLPDTKVSSLHGNYTSVQAVNASTQDKNRANSFTTQSTKTLWQSGKTEQVTMKKSEVIISKLNFSI